MKLLENSYVVVNKTPLNLNSLAKQEWLSCNVGNYYCKHCGCLDSAMADYSERSYGTARVDDIEGELSDYDINNSDPDGLEVYIYRCRECGEEDRHLDQLITDDPDEGWEVYKRYNDIVEEEIVPDSEEE